MDGGYDYSHFAVKGTEKQFVELNAYSVAGIPIPAERPTAWRSETRGLCSRAHRGLHKEVGPKEARASARAKEPVLLSHSLVQWGVEVKPATPSRGWGRAKESQLLN